MKLASYARRTSCAASCCGCTFRCRCFSTVDRGLACSVSRLGFAPTALEVRTPCMERKGITSSEGIAKFRFWPSSLLSGQSNNADNIPMHVKEWTAAITMGYRGVRLNKLLAP